MAKKKTRRASKKETKPEAKTLRIGITGASGFLGAAIIAEANAAGHRVVGFSRSPDRAIEGVAEVRDFQEPDSADYRDLDVLVHLAGEPVLGLWTEGKKRRIYESRVEGTRALVRGLEKLPPEERPSRLISASGIGFYGDSGDAVVDEDSDVGFGFLAEVVRDWEAAVEEASGIGMRTVMLRIGMVLGEGGGALPVLRKVFRGFLGGRLGSGRQWMSWIHVEDLARAFLYCANQEILSGPVNAVAPFPVTNRTFTETLAGKLDRPAFLPTPAFALRMAPGGMSEMFLNSQRVDPATLRLRGFEWRFPELGPALEDALKTPEVDAGE